jgi:hypothetical protein
MGPASRTLGAIGLVVTVAGQPAALRAQARDSAAPRPSAFDAIARQVLTLKLQSETKRERLTNLGVLDGSAGEWKPVAWSDSLAAMRTGVDLLSAEVRRLESTYARARHDQGMRLAAQLLALVDRVRVSLETLARSRDQRAARTALTHLGAALDALTQKIGEGEVCCQAGPR